MWPGCDGNRIPGLRHRGRPECMDLQGHDRIGTAGHGTGGSPGGGSPGGRSAGVGPAGVGPAPGGPEPPVGLFHRLASPNVAPWVFIGAVVLFGLLSALSHARIDDLIAEEEATGRVIAMAARQRMLSQRITLLSNRLVNGPVADRGRVRSELFSAINLMAASHDALVGGSDVQGVPGLRTEHMRDVYFDGSESLESLLQDFISSAREVASWHPDQSAMGPQLDPQLRERLGYLNLVGAGRLLEGLDEAVAGFEEDGREAIRNIRLWNRVVLATIVGSVILVGLFVFLPISHRLRMQWAEVRRARHQEDRTRLHLEAVFANAPGGIMVVDAAGNILQANARALELLELSRGVGGNMPRLPALLPLAPGDGIVADGEHPDLRPPQIEEVTAKTATGRSFTAEVISGWFLSDASWLRIVICSDVTERKKAEDRLRAQEEFFRSLYDNTPIMLHSITPEGQIVRVSRYWLLALGYDEKEVIGRPIFDFMSAESAEAGAVRGDAAVPRRGAVPQHPLQAGHQVRRIPRRAVLRRRRLQCRRRHRPHLQRGCRCHRAEPPARRGAADIGRPAGTARDHQRRPAVDRGSQGPGPGLCQAQLPARGRAGRPAGGGQLYRRADGRARLAAGARRPDPARRRRCRPHPGRRPGCGAAPPRQCRRAGRRQRGCGAAAGGQCLCGGADRRGWRALRHGRLPVARRPGRTLLGGRPGPRAADRAMVRHRAQPAEHPRRPGGGAHLRGGGRQGQERLPGQYEPRDPHPDERHHRPVAPGAGHRADGEAARLCGEDLPLRPLAARHHQRHPGFLEGRVRQPAGRADRLRPGRRAAQRVRHAGRPDPRQGPGGPGLDRAGRAAAPGRRPAAHDPDPDQPDRQCRQVHRTGRDRRESRGGGAGRGWRPARLLRPRYRDRHHRRTAGAPVPVLLAGRYLDHPPLWRHRPGPGDLQAAGGADGGAPSGWRAMPAGAARSASPCGSASARNRRCRSCRTASTRRRCGC